MKVSLVVSQRHPLATQRITYGLTVSADPDEFANFRNNAAYTNAGISVILQNAIQLAGKMGITPPSNWTTISNKITVLSDNSSGIVLEYGEYNTAFGCFYVLTCHRWF
jgi:trehalose/maltose hydrolase-like predicted phosphorylase